MQNMMGSLRQEFQAALALAKDSKALEEVKIAFLGKKGKVSSLMADLRNLSNEAKAAAGKEINHFKEFCNEAIESLSQQLEQTELQARMDAEWIDISLPVPAPRLGALHPVSLIQQRLEQIFTAMGFSILDGPHVETDFYNFEALNVPAHHPARDMQDTFYFDHGLLLRTQTSTIQIRGMEKLAPPLRIIGSGKVFRCERADASHDSCFHQMEGMLVDKDISVAHLIHFLQAMFSELFGAQVKVRLRPGYFPFVEPGFESEMACLICQGAGCKVCKQVGWVEMGGSGLVHPKVLAAGGIDPEVYSGFAFGMGLDRLAMMKYGISDIRELHGGGLAFHQGFCLPQDRDKHQ